MTTRKAPSKIRNVLILGSLALLLIVTGLPLWFWLGTNSRNAEVWIRQLIIKPIPGSVTNLKYGGIGGFDSIRCFSFNSSPQDCAAILGNHDFIEIDPIAEKKRFIHLFSEYLKTTITFSDGFRAYRFQESNFSITLLVSKDSTQIYAFVET